MSFLSLFRARPLQLGLILASAMAVSGCANVVGLFFKPYRFEIQQGNFVGKEAVERLRVGMTRDQVRFTLGTPMLTPIFRANVWVYLFHLRKTSGEIEERRLTVYFENDKLARWEGDEMPTERPVEPPVTPPTEPAKAAS